MGISAEENETEVVLFKTPTEPKNDITANPKIVILEKELKATKQILPLFQKAKNILDFDLKVNSQPQKSFKEWLVSLKDV